MPQTITVSTPDHIELEFQLAGIGSRFAAVALDHIIQFAFWLLLMFASTLLSADGFVEFDALLTVVVFLLIFAYFLFFEWLWGGQTPGKKITGLRVMYEDGRPVDFAGSAIRNILRLADVLPVVYGLGLTAMFISPKLQRLGDMAASTIVVIERPIRRNAAVAERPTIGVGPPTGFGLTRDDREAAIRFLERRAELEHQLRRELAIKISRRIAERAHIDVESALQNPEAFLESVAKSE
jgi:uncharacterized RDD family membrane protein YckC